MNYTFEKAKEIISTRSIEVKAGKADPFSINELMDIVKNTSGEIIDKSGVEGKPYLLYSGGMPNGDKAFSVMYALKESNEALVLSQSHVGELANDPVISMAIDQAVKKEFF
ncbi:hypothetical protein [Spartinivicinus poritis]|uniref:Uncharacterized protein n=1 Tax=Spartinivicinus poritis TaxID=2994640 RepID=A0ABT5UF39_9GAMM|nr:hypothetical protein [Spartinivicinus sp. A2-2]MDE1464083.1 hypothetical protein [Spartinivicinus sp. A2-2]